MDREALRAVLARLEIPVDAGVVLGIWPRPAGVVEVHLSHGMFWRTVQRVGPEVTSAERPDLLFPYRHAFRHDDVEFFAFSLEPVLRPGVLTPGFALRLT